MDIWSLLQTIFFFLLAFAALVVVHELGHYSVARWCGVKVLRFSVGIGQVVWSRRFGPDQTEWALSAWPLGGYVKMLDAREGELGNVSEAELQREFTRQSVYKRIAIVAAGPLANFLLAITIFCLLNMLGNQEPAAKLRQVSENTPAWQVGLRGGEYITSVDGEEVGQWSQLRKKLLLAALEKKQVVLETERASSTDPQGKQLATVQLDLAQLTEKDLESDFLRKLGLELARPPAVLGKMGSDSPAAAAGLQTGDQILQADGVVLKDSLDFVERVRAAPDKAMRLLVKRGATELEVSATPRGEMQGKQRIGRLRVEISAMPEMRHVSYPFFTALGLAVHDTWETSVMSVKMLARMVMGEVSWKNLTGPITIADYAGQSAKLGWYSYLNFIAFISLSLGVMNLLPIPVLDGGHLLYYSLELLRGRPLPERFAEIAQRAGVALLMMLMAVAMFNDIVSRVG